MATNVESCVSLGSKCLKHCSMMAQGFNALTIDLVFRPCPDSEAAMPGAAATSTRWAPMASPQLRSLQRENSFPWTGWDHCVTQSRRVGGWECRERGSQMHSVSISILFFESVLQNAKVERQGAKTTFLSRQLTCLVPRQADLLGLWLWPVYQLHWLFLYFMEFRWLFYLHLKEEDVM